MYDNILIGEFYNCGVLAGEGCREAPHASVCSGTIAYTINKDVLGKILLSKRECTLYQNAARRRINGISVSNHKNGFMILFLTPDKMRQDNMHGIGRRDRE